jgi:hypothetical protein
MTQVAPVNLSANWGGAPALAARQHCPPHHSGDPPSPASDSFALLCHSIPKHTPRPPCGRHFQPRLGTPVKHKTQQPSPPSLCGAHSSTRGRGAPVCPSATFQAITLPTIAACTNRAQGIPSCSLARAPVHNLQYSKPQPWAIAAQFLGSHQPCNSCTTALHSR